MCKGLRPHDSSSFLTPLGAMRQITGFCVTCRHLAIRQMVGRFTPQEFFVAGSPSTREAPICDTEGSRQPVGVGKSDGFATDVAGAAHAATTTMTAIDLRKRIIPIPIPIPIFSVFDG